MKHKIIVSIIVALFSTTVLAEDAAISNIRKIYENIQKLKKEKLDLGANYSTEGGQLTVYRDNESNIKILRV